MARLISIVLLTGILLQTFSKLIMYANYELNKEYITKMFCENKDKPKMRCNGKCHLKKQIREEEKKENAPINKFKEKYEIQLFSDANILLEFLNPYTVYNYSAFCLIDKSTSHLFSIFHPPTC